MSHQDLSNFFFDELFKINQRRGQNISDNSIHYVSDILLQGLNKEFIFKNNEKQYLTDLYQKAVNSSSSRERFLKYKYLGDYSLFISGYFSESINEVIGLNYYIDMGSQAYVQASHYLYREPYDELSRKYTYCIAILNEFSANRISRPIDICKLYTFWQSTKSGYAKEKLLTLGIMTEMINE